MSVEGQQKSGRKANKSGSGNGPTTPKVAKFIAEYLVDLNGTQAAIRAGYSPRSAKQTAHQLLTRPDVKAALSGVRQAKEDARQAAVQEMTLSVERTRREIARLAYFDPRKLYDAQGKPIPLTELDDDTAACIAGIEVLEERDPEGKLVCYTKKIKIADKNAALEKASKILGLFKKDNEQVAQALKVLMVPRKDA